MHNADWQFGFRHSGFFRLSKNWIRFSVQWTPPPVPAIRRRGLQTRRPRPRIRHAAQLLDRQAGARILLLEELREGWPHRMDRRAELPGAKQSSRHEKGGSGRLLPQW